MLNPLTHRKVLETGALDEQETEQVKRRILGG